MDPSELIRLESLLRYRLVDAGELAARPGTPLHEVPRFVVYRHVGGYVTTTRTGLPPGARDALAKLAPRVAFEEPETVRAVLGGPGRPRVDLLYHVPTAPPAEAAFGASRQGNHFVVLGDARPIAWAWTVEAHGRAELGAVETAAPFRRHGYGRRALAAWIRHVVALGKVPLVEHPGSDAAGPGLLGSLGAEPFAARATFP